MCVSLSLLTIILVVFLYIPIFVISYKIVNTKYKITINSNNMKPLYQFNWNKVFNPSNNSPSKGKNKLG